MSLIKSWLLSAVPIPILMHNTIMSLFSFSEYKNGRLRKYKAVVTGWEESEFAWEPGNVPPLFCPPGPALFSACIYHQEFFSSFQDFSGFCLPFQDFQGLFPWWIYPAPPSSLHAMHISSCWGFSCLRKVYSCHFADLSGWEASMFYFHFLDTSKTHIF